MTQEFHSNENWKNFVQSCIKRSNHHAPFLKDQIRCILTNISLNSEKFYVRYSTDRQKELGFEYTTSIKFIIDNKEYFAAFQHADKSDTNKDCVCIKKNNQLGEKLASIDFMWTNDQIDEFFESLIVNI